MPDESDLDRIREILSDRYEVISPIGRGGMASVFIARHKRHGGLVAVKVLAADLAEVPEIVDRFVQEARTAATLDGHPNVISIIDIGDANGMYYLLMPYLVGEDLGKYLKREGKMSPTDAANVMSQTLQGLNWAHRKGVIHRDIKPANLYLDQNGRVVVVDFGIAKLRDVPSVHTQANVRLGTTYYMCPEQIRGEPCDARSDLYTVGVVFYELLTGKRPFVGSTEREVLTGHLQQAPPDLQELDPTIPRAYAEIVNKLLEKEPARRYKNSSEVLAKLEALGQFGLPGQVRPVIKWSVPDWEKPVTAPPAPPAADANPAPVQPTRTASGPELATRLDRIPAAPVEAVPSAPTPNPIALEPKKNKLLVPLSLLGLVLAAAAGGWFWLSRGKQPAAVEPPKTAEVQTAAKAELPPLIEDKNHKKLALVPAGTFVFGDDSKESPNPKQTISLPAFYIDLTEVTVKAYKAFCAATGRPVPADLAKVADELPVTNVTWDDARAYASWMGERLPTEQEWEKAARGDGGRIFPWGDAVWERGANGPPKSLVGVESFPDRRSPVGAYNMAGNASEWTASAFPEDKKDRRYSDDFSRVLNGKPFSSNWYVIKGGHFSATPQLDFFFRAYMRRPWPEDVSSPVVGFRCVKDPPGK